MANSTTSSMISDIESESYSESKSYSESSDGSESEDISDSEISDESDSESTETGLAIGNIVGINQPDMKSATSPLFYYVKMKNKSYKSCCWLTKEEICETRKGTFLFNTFNGRRTNFEQLKSFKTNKLFSSNKKFELFIPITSNFDAGCVTPEIVLSMRKTTEGETEYLTKWLSLEMDQSTWENEEEIPKILIDEFERRQNNPHSICYSTIKKGQKPQFKEFSESPSFKNGNKLADYQVDGLNWLQNCWFQRKNSILADEMGLGKTIESISIIECLSRWYPSWGPFLVVCPLSTVSNWIFEFKKWTDFRVVSMMGKKESRKVIKKYLIYYENKKSTRKVIFDVLIVSYEWLKIELKFIKQFKFMYTIIDEAQKIKNANASIYEICRSIRSHHFLLMTGTPIQNDLFEIWSLLHFIVPSKFDKFDEFESDYSDKENPETIEKLQEVLRPYIFRRKKNDVNLDLPEKEEIIVEVEMTQIQRTFSQLFYKDTFGVLNDSLSKSSLNNIMMQLRKLYCHPFLFANLESICISQYKNAHNIPYDQPLSIDDEINSLILASGKTILIDKLLPKLKEGNHKVLIFSQFTSVLDILEDYLSYKHYSYERLDGSCSTTMRSRSIDKFQNDEETFIFLLSTRAGGLGINLTKADTVIIYDSDWNPQNDIQAQARCHRIGQTNKVNIYRLVTRGSYESEMFLRASKKLALDYAILDSAPKGKNDENNSINDKKELEMILKKGAYYTFKDDSGEIDKFCSENIDQILEHRSHTRIDVVSGGKSKFSKASFAATTEADVYKDDFWDKIIGNQNSNDVKRSTNSGIVTRKKRQINYKDKPIKEGKKSQKEGSSNLFYFSPKLDEYSSEDLKDLKVTDFCNFDLFFISADKSVYLQAISLLKKHGIGASRFFASEFLQKVCKTIIIFAFLGMPKKHRNKYYSYVKQFIPDFSKQINETPFKEFGDEKFMTSLIKGKELKIISDSYSWDVYYKVALYISNEKLPEDFLFAPEAPISHGWTSIDDFVAITSLLFSEKHSSFILDENLPFKSIVIQNSSLNEMIFQRVNIIVSEVNSLIPETFSIYESNLQPKKIGDVNKFIEINKHVAYPKKLTINLQKKLLRICYFYGIPKSNSVKKIKEILNNKTISDDLITIFIVKILIKAIKYQPNLLNLLKSIPNLNSDLICKNDRVDIRWIKEKAIVSVAANLDLIYRIRENFIWFNSSKQSIIENHMKNKAGINEKCPWWNFQCDINLFNLTAYYGFLFNSMICKFLKFGSIDEKDVSEWREKEIFNLAPIIIEKAKMIEPILSLENKKKRLIQITDLIQIERKMNSK